MQRCVHVSLQATGKISGEREVGFTRGKVAPFLLRGFVSTCPSYSRMRNANLQPDYIYERPVWIQSGIVLCAGGSTSFTTRVTELVCGVVRARILNSLLGKL